MKEVITVEAMVKSAKSLKPDSLKVLKGRWTKVAATHRDDSEKMRKRNRPLEADRLEALADTYEQAVAHLFP